MKVSEIQACRRNARKLRSCVYQFGFHAICITDANPCSKFEFRTMSIGNMYRSYHNENSEHERLRCLRIIHAWQRKRPSLYGDHLYGKYIKNQTEPELRSPLYSHDTRLVKCRGVTP